MSKKYKIYYIINDEIKKIYVFIGENLEAENLNQLIKDDPDNEIFNDIFDAEEITNIKNNNSIDISFFNKKIYIDDTIETIKKKYIMASDDENITYSGLYFFTKEERKLDTELVYRELTQNGKFNITRNRLIAYLLNIDDLDVSNIPVKEMYDYQDIFDLNFETKDIWMFSRPLGQEFLLSDDNYIITANPYNTLEYDDFLTQNSSDILTTVNQKLLMQYSNINKNSIFVCHVSDTLNYLISLNLSLKEAISIYFPYLSLLNIEDLIQYESRLEELKLETYNLINDETWIHNMANVELFYNISEHFTDLNLITKQGIKKINIILNPEYTYHLSLDLLFKILQTNEDLPLIKYNPSRNQENIYRIYADKKATNGKKIPYLTKGKILQLSKIMAKTDQLSLYLQEKEHNIYLNFYNDGKIEIKLDLSEPLEPEMLDTLIKETCNPIIETLQNILSERGYEIETFESIFNSNIEIYDLEYVINNNLTKKLNLKSIIKCLSSIFNLTSQDHDGAVLRFKKVADYNEMDSKEAYIVETLNQAGTQDELITGLIDNFNIKDLDTAKKILVDFINQLEVIQERGHFKKMRKYKIKSNPGFKTEMIRDKFETSLTTTIYSINNINYLLTIPIYINSILIITQAPEKLSEYAKLIGTQCKGEKYTKSEIKKDDVIATTLQPTSVQQINFDDQDKKEDPSLKKNMLAMLIEDSDDETEDEDEDESESKEEMEGGGDGVDELVDLTGQSLSNPNPVEARLQKYEPTLFLTNPQKGFASYSRSCPSSNRRQPIILTKEQKEKIDKDHKGSYDKYISYKSSPEGETYYYICPRYWDLMNKVSLTQEQVDSGKYGNIIPQNLKSVPPGGRIYEFNSKVYHKDEKGEYQNLVPGFMKPEKHPDGKCVPCCFKNWDAPAQVKLRQSCQNEEKVADEPPKDTAFKEYVKGPEKFPLENNRIGYLPLQIQQFLDIDNKECQISNVNTNIKPNHPCLVRIGIEKSSNQSFIGAIAKIYLNELSTLRNVSISEMKNILINALNIDLFVKLQNGNLIEMFDNGKDVDLSIYQQSNIFNDLSTSDPDKLKLLNKIASSYENYLAFLNSDNLIDYRYIWDLICFNNDKLFKQGLNLVIIEIKDDDITGNVGVICPTNHYATSYFDKNKKTAILIKINDLYEPIILYEDTKTKYVISRTFSLSGNRSLMKLTNFLNLIKNSFNSKCRPLNSLPRIYKFEQNFTLNKIISILTSYKYNILSQLVNYNGKIIGVEVNTSYNEKIIMVPVFPSAPVKDIPLKWIDLYNGLSYEDTTQLLNKINIKTKYNIPCAPRIKVINDELIVGIITQSNQFVLINPPQPDTFTDDLVVIDSSNYQEIDKLVMSNDDVDKERLEYIKKIKMESSFYNTFRNIIKIELNKYANNLDREEINTIVNDPTETYYSKLEKIQTILKKLVENSVNFVEIKDILLKEISDITTCNLLKEDKCSDNSFCLSENNTCILLIPKINLINESDNEIVYYGRIADELVRYNLIKLFILQPNEFLNFNNVQYNLKDDEIILLQSLLEDYFTNLTVEKYNKFISNNTYDTAEPLKSQTYSDTFTGNNEVKCSQDVVSLSLSKGNTWRNELPKNSKVIEFSNNEPECTFEIIKEVYKNYYKGQNKTINIIDLKNILIEEYRILLKSNYTKIKNLLERQGITDRGVYKLDRNLITIDNLILNHSYHLTILDIWILANKLKLPIVLYKTGEFIETGDNIILCYKSLDNKYYFIKGARWRSNRLPKYTLLINNEKMLLDVSDFSSNIQSNIELKNQLEGNLFDHFIENYKLQAHKRSKLKKPKSYLQKQDSNKKELERKDTDDEKEIIDTADKKPITKKLSKKQKKSAVKSSSKKKSPVGETIVKKKLKGKRKSTFKKEASVVEAPDEEAVVEAPDEEAVVEAPDEEAVVEAPVEETVVEAPVEQAVVEVPVEETLVEKNFKPIKKLKRKVKLKQ